MREHIVLYNKYPAPIGRGAASLTVLAVGGVGGAVGGFLLGTVRGFLGRVRRAIGRAVRRIVSLILSHRW